MAKALPLCLVITFLVLCAYEAQSKNDIPAWSAKVIRVSDGDTITVADVLENNIRIRVYGIDCPELAQARGKDAREYVVTALLHQKVALEVIETDKYGRKVAFVYLHGKDLAEVLLEQGLAWVSEKYCLLPICNRYKELERISREDKIGLWADKTPISPWEWRRQKSEAGRNRQSAS